MCGHGGTALSKYLLTGIKGENDISWCNFRGKSSSVKTLRLFFSSDGVVFGFGERSRSNENSWKFLKIRRVSGIISFTELERKESIRFHFLPVFSWPRRQWTCLKYVMSWMAYNLVFTDHKRRSYRRVLYSASGFHWFDFHRIVLLCASDNGCHSNSDVNGEKLSMFSNSFLCASNKFPSIFLCGALRGIFLMT